MYIRYVAYFDEGENPWHQNGLLTFSQQRIEEGQIHKEVRKSIRRVFKWYNKYIPCPPFRKMKKKDKWSADTICWWKESVECNKITIHLMRKLTQLLRWQGYRVKVMKTNRPGKIVYEDEYQIVAEIPKNKKDVAQVFEGGY